MDRLIHMNNAEKWVIIFSVIQVMTIFLAAMLDQYFVAFIPCGLAVLVLVSLNIRYAYMLLALVLPFSVEVELPGGLGTDLPSEPVMWLLTGLGIVYLASNPGILKNRIWKHPIGLLIIAHVMWIALTAILSQNVLVSAKFFLAKLWYVIPFFFLFVVVFNNTEKALGFFKILIKVMLIAITVVMIRHSGHGFSFESINDAVHPIFRNHVNYACMLVAMAPYVWAIYREERTLNWLLIGLIFIAAIYFSYTRAAMVALVIGILAYFIVRKKLSRAAIFSVLMVAVLAIPYLLHNNKYLDYAPEYERAIAHYNFENLIEATYRFEDISTMERLYRWVAGKEMIMDRPVFGFGPSTFYTFYQDYSIAEFQTYVSNNPEKSGIHNYYLMTMVEQGIPGFLIFLLLVIAGVIYGEKAFHRSGDKKEKRLVMASTVSLIIIASILIINDMVETDKVGPFFFMALGIIVVKSKLYREAE